MPRNTNFKAEKKPISKNKNYMKNYNKVYYQAYRAKPDLQERVLLTRLKFQEKGLLKA